MPPTAQQMRALPEGFSAVSDPRRSQGRRHPIRAVLAIAAGARPPCAACAATRPSRHGPGAQGLGQKGAQRIGGRRDPDTRQYPIPSLTAIREVLMRVDPEQLDRALGACNALWAPQDSTLAFDGKPLRNSTDEQGLRVPIVSAVGHDSKASYTQKKSPP